MKNFKLIPSTALLTVLILCIAPPMASAADFGFNAGSSATFSVGKSVDKEGRWFHKLRRGDKSRSGNSLKKGYTRSAIPAATTTSSAPKATVDNPEPITGLLALAAAGAGGFAARKRKKNAE